jgi:flagellar protein FliO/FliZ
MPLQVNRFIQQLPAPWRRLLFFFVGLFALWALWQWATTPSSPPPIPANATDAATFSPQRAPTAEPDFLLRYFLILAVLAGGGLWALHLRRRVTPAASTTLLRPLGQLSLGPGQQIRLVACGEELLVLGVTAHQITLLKSLPLPAELRTGTPGEAVHAATFARLLESFPTSMRR